MECGGKVFQNYGVNPENNILYIYIWLLVDVILVNQKEAQR